MSESKTSYSEGVGVLGLLGVAFVVLKLTGFIDWSWWFVLLPFYGLIALVAAIAAGAGLLALGLLAIRSGVKALKSLFKSE